MTPRRLNGSAATINVANQAKPTSPLYIAPRFVQENRAERKRKGSGNYQPESLANARSAPESGHDALVAGRIESRITSLRLAVAFPGPSGRAEAGNQDFVRLAGRARRHLSLFALDGEMRRRAGNRSISTPSPRLGSPDDRACAWASTARQRAATSAANLPGYRCAPRHSARACSH